MKLIIKICLLFFTILYSITISQSNKILRTKTKWLFDSFFKWESATFTVLSDTAKGEYSFSGKINSNERGVYFKDITVNAKDTINFMEDATYKHVIEKVESTVLDYELMIGCSFIRDDDSVFSGFKFTFGMRNFQKDNYKQVSYRIQIGYKWGSSSLGSVDPVKIISSLKSN